jgi:hypothetical protein
MIEEKNSIIYRSHTDAGKKALIVFYRLSYVGPAIIVLIILLNNSFRNDWVIWSIPFFLCIIIIAFGITLNRFAYKVVFKSNRDIEFHFLRNDQILYTKSEALLDIIINVYVSFHLKGKKIYFNGGRNKAFVDFLRSNYIVKIGIFSIIFCEMGFKDILKN